MVQSREENASGSAPLLDRQVKSAADGVERLFNGIDTGSVLVHVNHALNLRGRHGQDAGDVRDPVAIGDHVIPQHDLRLNAKRTGSTFQALSAEGSTLDGLNVHLGIIDELHAHKTRDVYDVVETATGQFIRDYREFFGATPLQDARAR